MPIDETPEEFKVRKFFERLTYTVQRIPKSEHIRLADYRVNDESERFLVEVKSRGPDIEFAKQLQHGSRAESEHQMARTNVISGQVYDAADQLAATDTTDAVAYRLIAFVAAGDDPDLQVDQFQKTIYGTVDLLTEESSEILALPCFYFTYNDFYRFRHIDGAVVLSPRGARLCVNTFGERAARLRNSRLCMQLMESGAVTDPSLIEKQQKGYIADTAVDRGDEEAILAYVRQKYDRTELLTFKPKKISVAVKINYEGLAGR